MIRIRLRRLVETEDALEAGDEVGELLLEEGHVEVLVPDENLRARLEALLQEPLSVQAGDRTGRSFETHLEVVGPGDPSFLPHLLERLERRDLRLTGDVVES